MNEEERYQDFDQARAAAEAQVAQERAAQEQAAQQAAQEQAAQQAAAQQQNQEPAQEAQAAPQQEPVQNQQQVNPYEAEARAAMERQQARAAMAQMQAQLQQLAAQNQQLQQLVQETSQNNRAAAEEETIKPPELDLSGLWDEDENVIKQKQAEYAQQMAEYNRQQIMKELAPVINAVQAEKAAREKETALRGLERVPELAGIMGMTTQLESIIKNNPVIASDAPIEDKLITAYAIAKGSEAIEKAKEPKKEMGVEDFVQIYAQNPALQRRIEQIRAEKAARSAVQTPPMSASAGAASAVLTPPEEPKDFDDAKKLILGALGIG